MQLRVARHTDNIERLIKFYREIIGLDLLGEFRGHQGYDGVFLGFKDASWHLEFTTSKEAPVHEPDEDDMLVFYPEDSTFFDELQKRLMQKGLPERTSKNPYWNTNGICVLDPDGFLVVISPKRLKK